MFQRLATPSAGVEVLKIVGFYALFASLWILFSDKALEAAMSDPALRITASILKGWAFVAITSIMLYALIHRFWLRINAANQAQQRTLGQLEAIADNSGDAIFVKDLDGRYTLFNRAACRYVGKPVEEVLGNDDRALFPPDQAAQLLAHHHELIANDRSEAVEETLETASGPAVFLAFKGPLHGPDGKIFGTYGISRDITREKQAQQEMSRLNKALRLLGEGNLAMVGVDSEQALLDEICRLMVTTGGYRMAWIGYTEHDADKTVCPIAQSGFDDGYLASVRISWDEHSEFGRGPTGAAIRTGQIQVNQDVASNPLMTPWRHHAREGGFQSSISLPLLSNQSVIGALSIYSEEREAFGPNEVTVLEKLAANLAFGIRALRERQERDSAEAANRAKSSFLANMSHEIRTPLNAISGMAHLLRRSGLTPKQEGLLDKMNMASHHLLEIIDTILDLSKIEAGRFVLEDTGVDIDQAIANALEMVGDRARRKQIELRVVPAPVPAHLHGDQTRLQQCLLNYLSNAVKFTEQGCITVRTRVLDDTDDSILVKFEVEDTGLGIAPGVLPRLFTAFEQADSSTTREYGGTGLGLAITRKLAQLMGGEAGATSTLGKGSTFWITVPFRKAGTPSVPNASDDRTDAERTLADHYKGRRVLVVDDDPLNREIAVMLLADIAAQRVDLAEDGRQAIDMVGATAYDLILMDMQMPQMDGLEATSRIRRLPHGKSVPIVAMTANAFAEDRRRCLAAGMDDFVAKPIEPDLFFPVLLKWLSAPGRAGSEAVSPPRSSE
jgi:PAS domain S-box-containing protein